MGGRKACVLKEKGVIIQGLVPPCSFGVWDHGLFSVSCTEKNCM